MPKKIEDSVVVITGAASGIGRETALEFAMKGAKVVVSGRSPEPLDELVGECNRLGASARTIIADVCNEAEVRELARRSVEEYGRIDVWVNNAAVTMFGRIEEVPYDSIRKVIDTNLMGCIHGARAVIPYFREQGEGTLIMVSSVAGKTGSPFVAPYVCTESAIIGLSSSLRMELEDAPGINVCTVLASSVDTPLYEHAANYTGWAVKPIEPVQGAQKVARQITSLAEHPQREVIAGGRRLLFEKAILPSFAEKHIARKVENEQFQDVQTPETDGNLYQPMDEWNTVSGGWSSTKSAAGLKTIGGLSLLAAAGYFTLKRRKKPSLGKRVLSTLKLAVR